MRTWYDWRGDTAAMSGGTKYDWEGNRLDAGVPVVEDDPEPRVELRGEVAEKYLALVEAQRNQDYCKDRVELFKAALKDADSEYERAWPARDRAQREFLAALL